LCPSATLFCLYHPLTPSAKGRSPFPLRPGENLFYGRFFPLAYIDLGSLKRQRVFFFLFSPSNLERAALPFSDFSPHFDLDHLVPAMLGHCFNETPLLFLLLLFSLEQFREVEAFFLPPHPSNDTPFLLYSGLGERIGEVEHPF